MRILRVAIVFLLAALVTAAGCGTAPKTEVFNVESMWVCSYIGGYKHVINIQIRPTDSASPDKEYVVELYKNGNLVDSKPLEWEPPAAGLPPKHERVYFPLSQEDYETFYPIGSGVEEVFSVKVRER